MPDFESQIVAALSASGYSPIKPKALARRLGLTTEQYAHFRKTIRDLVKQGRVEFGRNHTLRPIQPNGSITGVFRRTSSGDGYVRPNPIDGKSGPDILIREEHSKDASTGDVVAVRIARRPKGASPLGVIWRVMERATQQFVGTYFERDGDSFVRVDGTVFSHSVYVGDPGAKGAKPDDKVVIEMLRYPTTADRGEGVLTEVLGPRGQPGVDTLTVIRTFGIPDEFPPDVLQEARDQAALFNENDLAGRTDFTAQTIVTIDPVDARDFDDAISLTKDEKTGHWLLGVHIADVAHFVSPGGSLDREARKRGTSVYLPQRVIPMFPEVISNGLASLQQDRVRYVKSALIELSVTGQKINVRFANGAIRNKRRFTYDEVARIYDEHDASSGWLSAPSPPGFAGGEGWGEGGLASANPLTPTLSPAKPGEREQEGLAGSSEQPEVLALLLRMRELAEILRKRRRKRGFLELDMPETELEFDDQGRVTGAHFVEHNVSHQVIEEFMLTANEAVADHLARLDIAFLRRVHPAPDPLKLESFAEFARLLGYKVDLVKDRFGLQRVLGESLGKADQHAVHFALLRSLKQAQYSPNAEGHYALASNDYCHFTSPIRRYPDLTVHRLLGQWIKTGRAGSDEDELAALGEHCSRTERRAETAERELKKWKLLTYMSERIGEEMTAIITGVADYGFFAQAEKFPVEGLVHISSLGDDYYYFEAESHTLRGRRTKRRYRLGDRVKVQVARVDLSRRQLDFRLV